MSLGVALAILGAIFGFFGAWAIPGIRTQQEVAFHIALDNRRSEDHESRIRDLERFAARGDRWSRQDQFEWIELHATRHEEEMKDVRNELAALREQYARIDTRLKEIERRIVR